MKDLVAPCGKKITIGDSAYQFVEFMNDQSPGSCEGCRIRRFMLTDVAAIVREGKCTVPKGVPKVQSGVLELV